MIPCCSLVQLSSWDPDHIGQIPEGFGVEIPLGSLYSGSLQTPLVHHWECLLLCHMLYIYERVNIIYCIVLNSIHAGLWPA